MDICKTKCISNQTRNKNLIQNNVRISRILKPGTVARIYVNI